MYPTSGLNVFISYVTGVMSTVSLASTGGVESSMFRCTAQDLDLAVRHHAALEEQLRTAHTLTQV